MPANIPLNMLETYTLMAIGEEIVPRANFFRDRYFPTDAGDLFASDKVLTEYRKGDRAMASFVSLSSIVIATIVCPTSISMIVSKKLFKSFIIILC